jgi:septal ring-binding cell division protein DamX
MAGASTTVGRSARRHAERGKGPVIAGITALVLLGGAAGVYYLGGPLALFDRFSGTEASPTPAAAPPPTTLAPTMSTAPLAPDQTPTQAETPTSTPGEASTPAAALPTATPSPTSTAAGVPGSVDASRAALRSGRFDDAAAGFASSMGGAGTHAIQLLVACARESVDKAVQAVSAPALYVLPVDFKGKACYRICWGAYTSQADAGAALQTVPSYFIDNGARPRVVPLSELLP